MPVLPVGCAVGAFSPDTHALREAPGSCHLLTPGPLSPFGTLGCMLTSLAGIFLGVWLAVEHSKLPDSKLTLVRGIVVAALCLGDLVWSYRGTRGSA